VLGIGKLQNRCGVPGVATRNECNDEMLFIPGRSRDDHDEIRAKHEKMLI